MLDFPQTVGIMKKEKVLLLNKLKALLVKQDGFHITQILVPEINFPW